MAALQTSGKCSSASGGLRFPDRPDALPLNLIWDFETTSKGLYRPKLNHTSILVKLYKANNRCYFDLKFNEENQKFSIKFRSRRWNSSKLELPKILVIWVLT
jgi:hypothetical protein